MDFFSKKLKEIRSNEKGNFLTIPFNSNIIKFEMNGIQSHPQGESYGTLMGIRVYININAPILSFLDNNFMTKKIRIIKRTIKNIDYYYIDPRSEQILFKTMQEKEDSEINSNWHISFDFIKEEKLKNFRIARFPEFEKQQEGKPFFLPKDDLIFNELNDFGEFKIKKENIKISFDEAKKFYSHVILEKKIRDKIELELCIEEICRGGKPKNAGIVLYGPGGTGKTTNMNAYADAFKAIGAKIIKCNLSEINTSNFGAYPKYLNPKFNDAIQEGIRRGIPSFIYVDEADPLVEKAHANANESNSHAGDIERFMKSYIGNHDEFIFCMSTNLERKKFGEIVTRAGRLEIIEVGYPTTENCISLLVYNINKYKIKLKKEFLTEELIFLGKWLSENKKVGADIDDFCDKIYRNHFIETSHKFSFEEFKDLLIKFISDREGDTSGIFNDLISKEENSQFFINLLNPQLANCGVSNTIENEFNFSHLLKDFYLSAKSNIILSSDIGGNSKIRYYNYLISLVKNLPNYFNHQNYWIQFKNKKINDDNLINFFKDLFNNLIKSEDEDFTSIFEKVLNNFNSNKSEKSQKDQKSISSIQNQADIIDAQIIPNETSKISKKDQKIIENIEKTFDWINSNFKILGLIYMKKYPKKLDINKFNTQFNNSLNYLFQNMDIYFNSKNIKKGLIGGKLRNIKKVISNTIITINNWKKNGYITPTEYSALIKYLMEIIELKRK